VSDLIAEWHSHNPKSLSDYTPGSNHRAWWLCAVCEHSWQASIHNRTRGSGCPNCYATSRYGASGSNWKGHEGLTGSQWNKIKKHANRENGRIIPFEISIEYAWKLFLQQDCKCALTGVSIILQADSKHRSCTASLDRIDSSEGYVVGNVQWVHKVIQQMKWDQKEKDFIQWCKLVTEHKEKTNG
jgi:hypothetical protein